MFCWWSSIINTDCCCCPVAKSCLILSDPIDCSTLGFSVLQYLCLLKSVSIELVMLSNHHILCYLLLLLPSVFFSIRSFPMSQLFASFGQSIRTSASTSMLPMIIQGWFPLGWTGWISLQFKGLSRVFSNTTTVQKH